MCSFRWKASLVGRARLCGCYRPCRGLAQSTIAPAEDHPNWVSIVYEPPENPAFQDLYDLLRERHALESIREILSALPLARSADDQDSRVQDINAWYRREAFKPTVTVCYELLKQILGSLPNENSSGGLTPDDAAVGQFFFVDSA